MSHGANVGVYVLIVYVLPTIFLIGIVFAFARPTGRAVIAIALSVVLWGYSICLGISLLLFPAPLMTGLFGMAALIGFASVVSLAARWLYRRARAKVS